MTKAQLIKQLQSLENFDPEVSHVQADKLLLEYIDDEDIEAAFEAVEKWYA